MIISTWNQHKTSVRQFTRVWCVFYRPSLSQFRQATFQVVSGPCDQWLPSWTAHTKMIWNNSHKSLAFGKKDSCLSHAKQRFFPRTSLIHIQGMSLVKIPRALAWGSCSVSFSTVGIRNKRKSKVIFTLYVPAQTLHLFCFACTARSTQTALPAHRPHEPWSNSQAQS